jgi:hypothetical protein
MKRGCRFSMSPSGTDVKRVVAHSGAPVGRCLSTADASLSLSLSLSCPSSTPLLAARFPRFEQYSRGWATHTREAAGVPGAVSSCPDAVSRSGRVSVIRRRRHPHLAVAVEEVPRCAPTRWGCCSGRRGLNPRPRRPLIFARDCSRVVLCPLKKGN